jgi:hypothetical protein
VVLKLLVLVFLSSANLVLPLEVRDLIKRKCCNEMVLTWFSELSWWQMRCDIPLLLTAFVSGGQNVRVKHTNELVALDSCSNWKSGWFLWRKAGEPEKPEKTPRSKGEIPAH